MSVRRLAEKQPASFEFTPENKAWAEKEIAKYPPGRQASAVIALLWRAQEQNGYWLPQPAIEKVAAMLDMPQIRALEVATFYTMFNLAPVGRHTCSFAARRPACCAAPKTSRRSARAHRRAEPRHAPTACSRGSRSSASAPAATRRWCRSTTTITRTSRRENFAKLLDDLAAGRPGEERARRSGASRRSRRAA